MICVTSSNPDDIDTIQPRADGTKAVVDSRREHETRGVPLSYLVSSAHTPSREHKPRDQEKNANPHNAAAGAGSSDVMFVLSGEDIYVSPVSN